MICFNCGINLHNSDAKECQLCGVKFAFSCHACDFPNPAMAKYCCNCGSMLMRGESQSSIQNFDTLSENRKNVAVIFADVSGFTALSEKMDPEEVRELINDCFNYITRPVYELEGTIDKYIGDCVMILFGAKYTHSDDAKRAVLCAVKMMKLIEEFSKERLVSKGLSISLSIGINYGLVVTGSVGNAFDKDYTVMGDIVNTAQRLQSSAQRGTILVSESVLMETKDFIRYNKPVEIKVKNKEKPVRCYSTVEVIEVHERKDTFVGRQNEINTLVTIFNSVLNTGTKCVSVIGEAGVGKTSLLKTFTRRLGTDVKKVWVDLNSLTSNRVYYTLSVMLMNIMNISPGDSLSVKQRRLMSFLDYILGDLDEEERKRNYDFLGLILGFSRDNEFQIILSSMSFDSIKREIVKQLSVFFTSLSRKYRLVVIIDDLHWSDVNSLGVIKELIKAVSNVSVMFVLSSRYEIFVESQNDSQVLHCDTIKLDSLEGKSVSKLVCKLLGCSKIEREFFDLIVKFTKGNPLYIVEFIHNIMRTNRCCVDEDTARIKPGEVISLPQNIQSLILANLSQFDDQTRNLLQTASVIGREFNISLMCALLNCSSDDINDLLRFPVQMNIISLKTAYTVSGIVERIFMFNQDMEREVIYDSILNKEKRELHNTIGETIEAKYFKYIEEYYEILYVHFYNAGQNKKAVDYSFKTAIRNKDSYNFSDSLEYYVKFLNLRENEDVGTDSRVFDAYKDMGYINFIMANYDMALENLNKAIKTAQHYNDIYSVKLLVADVYKQQDMYDDCLNILEDIEPKMRQESSLYGKLLQMKCSVLRIVGNSEALNIAKKSEKLLSGTKDYENLSETMNQAGIIYYTRGDIKNSLFYLDKSYKYAEKINNLAIMAKVSGNLGAIYHATGLVSNAQEYFNKSIYISKKISDQQGYIAGCINLGILYMDKGLFTKGEELFNEAIDISKEISTKLNESIALTNIGDIMYERGKIDKALEYYNNSLAIIKEINVPIGEGINYLSIARLYIESGEHEMVIKNLEAAYEIFDEAGEIEYLSDYYRYKALYYLKMNNIDEALENCSKAISISQEIRSDIRNLKALRIKAQIMSCINEVDSSFDLFTQSITLSHQIESDYEAAKGYFERFLLYKRLGSTENAQKDLALARECINKVDSCSLSRIIQGI